MSSKQAADSILLHHWLEDGVLRLPVDPEHIANQLGLTVAPLPEDRNHLSGEIDNNQILFNDREPEVRRRFTIAHELGHFVLQHGHAFRDPNKNFSIGNYDPREVAANKFAVELLMPEVAVRQFVEKEKVYDAQVLADRFGVSLTALRFRLENLGLI